MKPSSIARSIELCVTARRPPFIWGPPGVGKSQIVAQVAAKLGLQLIDVRLCLLDPVDLRGLPNVLNGSTSWSTPCFLPRDGQGILFFDEFPQAPPMMQNAASQLLLDRKLGEYRLPDGWQIVGAGDGQSSRAATHKMPTHIARRWIHHDLQIDHDEFSAHALAHNFRIEVIAVLWRKRPKLSAGVSSHESRIRLDGSAP